MSQLIRVLLVTNHFVDVNQWIDLLRQQGLAPEWLQVDHESDYCTHLHAELDLIVTKYALPMFDAPRALQLVQERGLAIPVIVIVEPNNEEAGLDCLRDGAADYLSSDRLARLGMAAVRAIEHSSHGTERTLTKLIWRESLHQAVLRSMTAHLAVLDASGMVVLVNKPWEEPVCEHSLPHMMLARVGMNYLNGCQMIYGEDADLAHQMIVGIQAILNRTDDHFVLEYMRMQGSEERWFVLDVTPVDRNHAGAIVAHKNITLRKRAEVALEQERALLSRRVNEQTADLRLANAELARSARLKDEFLANMSHELRTPLNAILGLSEALEEQIYGSLNDKQLRTLRNIQESGRHLLALINDILDISKIEAGKMDIDTCAIDVLAVCRTSLQFIAQQAFHKQISLVTSFDPAVTWIMADQRRLKQIFVNLLSNAVKFTPVGGSIGVDIAGDGEQRQIRLTVWDTGIGIAPENLGQLFRPFVQLDSSLSRAYEGTGLGLSLVARLTELHGGRVEVHSQVGCGSRFTVSLPWIPALISTEPEQLNQLGETARLAPAVVRTVLVVEDSPTATSILTHYLRGLGFTCFTLAEGQDVLRTACTMQPDVIILDILLPDRTGWDILAELQADPRTQTIPVVIVSVIDERVKGLALGARECLVKPVTQELLAAVLQQITSTSGVSGVSIQSEPVGRHPQAPAILLVEDNPANIMMVAEYLETKGYQIDIARSGGDALAQTRARRPDLILMDIQMPGMDGLAVTQQLRKEAEFAAIPIIALTALAMPSDSERCFAAGVDAYLSKPISLKTLITTIEHYIAHKF